MNALIFGAPPSAKLYNNLVRVLQATTGFQWGYSGKTTKVKYISSAEIPIRVTCASKSRTADMIIPDSLARVIAAGGDDTRENAYSWALHTLLQMLYDHPKIPRDIPAPSWSPPADIRVQLGEIARTQRVNITSARITHVYEEECTRHLRAGKYFL